jgi:TonB family protein
MKCGLFVGIALLVVTGLSLGQNKQSTTEQKAEHPTGQSDEKESKQPDRGTTHGPLDILSDTGGMDVHPYLDRVLPLLKHNWYIRVPESAEMKRGKLTVLFYILKDGRITDVHYGESSGDPELDQAAYDGVADSSPLPSLPAEFNCKFLRLQIHFYYNIEVPSEHHPDNMVPCVSTKISSVAPFAIRVSPALAEVFTGAKQRFVATLTGDLNAKVEWRLSGSGCSGSTCGTVSSDGLYSAPSRIPSSPKVIVTAVLANDPTETATATVTVVESPTPH